VSFVIIYFFISFACYQVHPEGKFVVDLDKNIDINDVTANSRVALRSDSYTLHKILPNKVCNRLVSWLPSLFAFILNNVCIFIFIACATCMHLTSDRAVDLGIGVFTGVIL